MTKFDILLENIYTKLKKNLSNTKFKHSKRVAKHLKFAPKYVRLAALYHDYLERGGNLKWLKNNFSKKTILLIQALTNKSDKDPLQHMKEVLNSVDQEERDFLILIKLSDRIDNYKKRLQKGSLSSKYKTKTKNLLKFLENNYQGDYSLFNTLKSKIKI